MRIVAIGEALIDLVETAPNQFEAVPGGSVMNVAVALARLGLSPELFARISTDRSGALIRQHLAASGVSDRSLVPAHEPTTVALARVTDEGSAEYQFYGPNTADWQWTPAELHPVEALEPGDLVVTGGLAAMIAPGAAHIADAVVAATANGVRLIYDVNIRPALARERDFEVWRTKELWQRATLVKASDEDLAWLVPGYSTEQAVNALGGASDTVVIVTHGADGATVFVGDERVTVGAAPAEVVDTVGAGDTYLAALVHELAHPRTAAALWAHTSFATPPTAIERSEHMRAWAEALEFAAAAASLTVARRGANPPTLAEVHTALDRIR